MPPKEHTGWVQAPHLAAKTLEEAMIGGGQTVGSEGRISIIAFIDFYFYLHRFLMFLLLEIFVMELFQAECER